jgi:hypothetical protein
MASRGLIYRARRPQAAILAEIAGGEDNEGSAAFRCLACDRPLVTCRLYAINLYNSHHI